MFELGCTPSRPSPDMAGTAHATDPREEFLSHIIARLNALSITDNLAEKGPS